MYILPATTNTPARASQDDVWVYLVWGQSMIGGGFDRNESEIDVFWHDPDFVVPGCYAWNKQWTTGYATAELVDSARSNADFDWKPLRTGAIEQYKYWWEPGSTFTYVEGGETIERYFPIWNQSFIQRLRTMSGRRIYLVQCAFGGSTLQQNGSANHWSVDGLATPTTSYLHMMMESYWKLALQSIVTAVGGDRTKIKMGGVVSMIGTSEVFSTAAASAYGTHLGEIIDYVRGIIAPDEEESLPWLVLPPPRSLGLIVSGVDTVAAIDTIRAGAASAASARTGVDFIDCINCPQGSDGVHFGAVGNDVLGAIIAEWALGVTPYTDPQGD